MRTISDPETVLARGLDVVRSEFQVPAEFSQSVTEAAAVAARRPPNQHVDRTSVPFVTLDPASSTDLDQAFWIEASGGDIILQYAIADVGWFVHDGDPVDTEAWRRGETLYLPGSKVGLYPPVLSEGAASLLPDGPRPAVVFAIRVSGDGTVALDGAERALIKSRAKLAYDSVTPADLPNQFEELARRIQVAEQSRGAARVDPPAQELVPLVGGSWGLAFRPTLASETRNAAMSLAANLAIADALYANRTGLFRLMAEPDALAVERLRKVAVEFGIAWPTETPLDALQRGLNPNNSMHAAFMLAIRRAARGASYAPYVQGVIPWHSAVAATYAHATAPLRRLADRYVGLAALAVANGRPIPGAVSAAFARLPEVMARADSLAGKVNRAALDLAETILLTGKEGSLFAAVVTDVDERGARLQLRDGPVVARIRAEGLQVGTRFNVRLTKVDLARRGLNFELA